MQHLLYKAVDAHTGIHSEIRLGEDGVATVINRMLKREMQIIADHAKRQREFWARLSLREKALARLNGFIVGHTPILLWAKWRKEWDAKYRSYMTWQEFEINKLNSEEFGEYRCTEAKVPMPVSAKAQAEDQITVPLLSPQARESERRRLMVAVHSHGSHSAVVAA